MKLVKREKTARVRACEGEETTHCGDLDPCACSAGILHGSLFVLGQHVVEDVEELVSVVIFEDESGTEADGVFTTAT